MITPVWIVGFSGHRFLAHPQKVAAAIKDELTKLKARCEVQKGRLEFYSSAACGSDTLAAMAAEELGIPVHLVLPMPEENFKADFVDASGRKLDDDWKLAQALISRTRAGHNGGTLRLVRGTQLRPECYYDAGVQMLEACDLMLIIWDGLPARGLGGTADMVELSLSSGKPFIMLSPQGQPLRSEKVATFASADDPQLQLIQKLNKMTLKRARAGEATAKSVFQALDATANDTARSFRTSLVRSIKFHGWATVIAAFAVMLPKDQGWSNWLLLGFCVIEMVLVTWALFLSQIHGWRKTHDQWLSTRFGAELVRGLRSAVAFADPLTPQILRHSPYWRRFALAVGLSAYRTLPRRTRAWEKRRRSYVKARLMHQKKHFGEKQAAASITMKRTQLIGTWATWLAPCFVLLALIYKLMYVNQEPVPEPFTLPGLGKDMVLRFMPIFVPLVAGMASGLRAALDSTRRAHRYAELAQHLQLAASSLGSIKTEASARRRVIATEEVLLDELIEWKLAEEQNGGH